MTRRITLALTLVTLALMATEAMAQTRTLNLNSGYDQWSAPPALIDVGKLDNEWRVSVDPTPTNPAPPERPADVVSDIGWGVHPSGSPGTYLNSRWISTRPSRQPSSPPSSYQYAFYFTLPAGFSSPQLTMDLNADDHITSVTLNSCTLHTGSAGAFNAAAPLHISSQAACFVSGPNVNVITVTVQDTGAVITGLIVAGNVTYEDCPRAAIKDIPGLESITFWEATSSTPMSFTFPMGDSRLITRRGDPLNSANRDFEGVSFEEFYDVFYSDANGSVDANGQFVTIEATWDRGAPAGGGLNIARIDLKSSGQMQFANGVTTFVVLGDNALPDRVGNAVDALTSTHTTMGNTIGQTQRLRVTVGFPCACAAPSPLSLFNTGRANDGSVLPDATADPHYTLTLPSGAPGTAQVSAPLSLSWLPNNATSKWIVPSPSTTASGDYIYRTTFELAGCETNSVIITGRWASDNDGFIRVNGGAAQLFPTPLTGFQAFTPFTLDSSNSTWVAGINTLEFVVHNESNVTGVRVEMSGTVVCCPCVAPPIGLVNWWPFDETIGTTAHDIRGFVDNFGLHANGPTPSEGEVGGALCFDGMNDQVEVANDPEINFPSACPFGSDGPFTIDAWVRTSDSSGVDTIIDKRVSPGQPVGYSLFLADGRLGFQLADGTVPGSICGTAPSSFPCTNYVAPGPPSPEFVNVASGDWHFVAVTVTKCPVAVGKMYVDGNLIFTFIPRTGNIDNSAALQIGRRLPAFGETHFDGCIDELEFFKRALSEDEIRAIFEARGGGKCFREPCPEITINPATLVNSTWLANVPYPTVTLMPTGGTGPYTFTVSAGALPPGLVLDPDGTLHGTPNTQGTFNFSVAEADVNACPGTRDYQIVIECPAITLNPAAGALPASFISVPYSQTFTATGGCGSAFTFSVTSGALPPNFTLSASGVLSGTSTAQGNFTFNVTATDSCGCSQTGTYTLRTQSAPNIVTTKTLVISAFRENGPNGAADEFVEIFNPSDTAVTVSALSGDPNGPATGIGVFSNSGSNGGTLSNGVFLRCHIPGSAVIKGRGWYLCGGSSYSLSDLGLNGGTAHSVPDVTIGTGNAFPGDIPNDAGLVLLNIGTNIVTACPITQGSGSLCPTGFSFPDLFGSGHAVVFDKVGFRPYGPGAPGQVGYPSLAHQYCEGLCLQPVGDASTIVSGLTCPAAVGPSSDPAAFPVQAGGFVGSPGTPVCYGESGQYKIDRRRSAQQFDPTAGNLHRDTDNNADDFILDAPNPGTGNVGEAITGTPGVSSVLGAAGPHNSSAPAIIDSLTYTESGFDTPPACALCPKNAERQYGQLDSITNAENDPNGVLILRRRFTNAAALAVTGARYRVDDITTLCGGQTGTHGIGSKVATQEARNLRGPDFKSGPANAPVPSCQGEGSDMGLFTAILKAVNHHAETVTDSSNNDQLVLGAILEDTSVTGAGTPAVGRHQPFGGGSNSSYVTTDATPIRGGPNAGAAGHIVGDGVNGGVGTFVTGGTVRRVAFKFGVVKSGRFKLLIGPEVAR